MRQELNEKIDSTHVCALNMKLCLVQRLETESLCKNKMWFYEDYVMDYILAYISLAHKCESGFNLLINSTLGKRTNKHISQNVELFLIIIRPMY